MTAVPKMTSRQVAAALWEHFCSGGNWAMLSEVVASTGRDDGAHRAYRERRIDALLVRRSRSTPAAPKPPASRARRRQATSVGQDELPALNVESLEALVYPYAGQVPDDGGMDRIAIEIKVSRADFFSDIRNPAKQAPWRELADRHAYAVPAGLVRMDEVPAGSGLIEVRWPDEGREYVNGFRTGFQWKRRAPRVATARPLPLPIILDAFYRAGRLEARAKGYMAALGGRDDDGDGDVEALRMELKRVRHELDLAGNRIEREVELRTRWQKRYAAHGSPPCATCGKPLRPIHGRRSRWDVGALTYGWQWDHSSVDDHNACQAIRTAAALEAKGMKEAPKGDYLWVAPPEPDEPEDAAAA